LWVQFQFLPEHTVSSTPKVTGGVTGEVERLVFALEGRMSRVQIQQALGLRHEDPLPLRAMNCRYRQPNGVGYFHRSPEGEWRFSCQFY